MQAKFTGRVKGFTEDDEGNVHLAIEDTQVSDEAARYAEGLRRSFNPQAGSHGYGARDVQCKVFPGLANYHFTVSPDAVKGISQGGLVEVEVDIYSVRRVRFLKTRWAGFPEIRADLVTIRPSREPHQGGAKQDKNSGS